jgi:hypothetical protein
MKDTELDAIVRGLTPVVRELLQDQAARLAALEAERPGPELRDRLTRLEVSAIAASEGTSLLGALRERVAVVETRAVQPGPSGPPGLGFEDLRVDYDGERTVTLTFERDGVIKTFPLRLPIDIYRGTFVIGKSYQPGDTVTWSGGVWRCSDATSAKPGEGGKGWKLIVKPGRDGRDAGGAAAERQSA